MISEKIIQFVSNYKQFGHLSFNSTTLDLANHEEFSPYIKVLFVPTGYKLTVDFNSYETDSPSLFFINSNQYLNILEATEETAQMLIYNRDFYCIQIHDQEVACDGLLFNNIFQLPKIDLDDNDLVSFSELFDKIQVELKLNDRSSEEMIRIYLKQIIIQATRVWKNQNLIRPKEMTTPIDHELFRNFGRLVEIHFREKHTVTDYADLLNVAPKTLSNKFHKLQLDSPNDIIKNRIMLEAKRLLSYTDLSIKEIAHQLGYEDTAYFNRLFAQKNGVSPTVFRKTIDL